MLRKLVVGALQANCYILGCEKTGKGVVIDPGDEARRITKEIAGMGITVGNILLTHAHFDHTSGVPELKKITGAPVLIHPLDAGGLNFRPDEELSEGREIPAGRFRLRVIHTPGHSPGGVCFFTPGAVFTGDTLFAGSVGRTDFPGGSHENLVQAVVQKIFPLGDSVRVYPGHGPNSTIGRERTTNPFFRGMGMP